MINVDGEYFTPAQFKTDVLPKHPGRWPNCASVTCMNPDCGTAFVSFGLGCPVCGGTSLREM